MEQAEFFVFGFEQLSRWTDEAVLFYKSRRELHLDARIRQLKSKLGEPDWTSRSLILTLKTCIF